jgi:hypothetical protein
MVCSYVMNGLTNFMHVKEPSIHSFELAVTGKPATCKQYNHNISIKASMNQVRIMKTFLIIAVLVFCLANGVSSFGNSTFFVAVLHDYVAP